MAERSDIFITYCFPEKRWLDRVQAELEPIVGNGRCVIWDERKLRSGIAWKTELPEVLANTKVAMMIVSDLFLESDFVTRARLPALLEVERKSGLEICWVLASHCLFELAGLKESDAGNRVAAALDGLGSSQRDAEAAAIARKVATLLGIESAALLQTPAIKTPVAKTAAAIAAPATPKQTRKKRKDIAPEKPEGANAPAAATVPPPTPAPAPLPVAPPESSPAKALPTAPVQPLPSASAPLPITPTAPSPTKPLPTAPAQPSPSASVPPPLATASPSPVKLLLTAPAQTSPSASAPPPITTAAPSSAQPSPSAAVPLSITTAGPSPAKPLPAATTPSALEPAPAPATVAMLIQSLDATIQTRQATVLKLSRLARWLIFAAAGIALASIVVAVIKGFTHFLLVAGYAAFVAALALRLHARSRSLGQGLVGMRYTRGGLADEALLTRQREGLMRKAEDYLAQN